MLGACAPATASVLPLLRPSAPDGITTKIGIAEFPKGANRRPRGRRFFRARLVGRGVRTLSIEAMGSREPFIHGGMAID